MISLHARNVNEGWALAKLSVWKAAKPALSRNGVVYRLEEGLAVRFARPLERVLFDPARNANPFFHLMEALWMLGGRSDLTWIEQFNGRMREFSDDGRTLPASYGVRWRRAFGYDQLRSVVNLLEKFPDTRRAVINMWNPGLDLPTIEEISDLALAYIGSKDVPCNLSAVFSLRAGALCLTVFNRSNDLAWGLFGANVVQFSMLQEYVARWLGAGVGWYEHVTADAHIYPDHWAGPLPDGTLASYPGIFDDDPYRLELVRPTPLFNDVMAFEEELAAFLSPDWERAVYSEAFFVNTALPVRRAWNARRDTGERPWTLLRAIHASDWRRACWQWLERFQLKHQGQTDEIQGA